MKIYTINEVFEELEKGRGKDKVKRKAKRFRVGGVLSMERAKAKGYGRWKEQKEETGVESFPKQFPGVLYRRGSVL